MVGQQDKPGDTSARLTAELAYQQARLLLAAERPLEAIETIESALTSSVGIPDPIAFQLLMQKGEAHRQIGNVDSAIDAISAGVALQPDDESALQQLGYLTATAGYHAQSKPYRERLFQLQARRLPVRLADGLQELWQRARDIPLDSPALEWAWELADRAAWGRAEWQTAATWGNQARLLLRQWWQTAPHKSDQIDKLIVRPDLRLLSAARVQHDSCILVGAHVGPTVAGLGIFRTENRPFQTFGSADRDRADGAMLIPLTSNSVASMRTLVNKVRGGTTIGLLGDEPLARDSFLVDFLGRQIELPPYVPRLIQSYELPSFWCCPLWRSGRIIVKLERLPDPFEGESRSQWSRRWFGAYLDKLEKVMRGRPENLGLFSGIWDNVNSVVARERRRLAARGRRRSQTFTYVAATRENGPTMVADPCLDCLSVAQS